MKQAIQYTLVFIGIQLLAAGIVTIAAQLIGGEALITSPYVNIISMALFAIVTAAVFLKFKWTVVTRDYLQTKPRMVILWSIMAAIGAVIPSTAFQELFPDLPNIAAEELASLMSTTGGYFILALLVPLVEEMVFRGAVLRALLVWKPQNPWGMIALSALFFSLMHMNPAQMPHAFIIGLLLGWMFYRTNSIVPSVAFHWANNTVAYILFKLYPDPNIHLFDILGTQRNVAAAVVFSLFILVPAIYQLNVWMKRVESE